MATPSILVCNRLADMNSMHPDQDDSHVCHKCKHPVGIYPSGQKAMKRWPTMLVVCEPCARAAAHPADINIPAAETAEEFVAEARASKPVIHQ